VFSIFRS